MATTPAKRACSVCGRLLAVDSPYCPVCALRGVGETQSDSLWTPLRKDPRFDQLLAELAPRD